MKPVYGAVGVCLVWLTLGMGTASAAWDNVFQVTCHSCRKPTPIRSFFAPRPVVVAAAPATDCCPQPTISYRQRCFYQPVTSYRMATKVEPVTSYRMSYYYEPVTTVRYMTYRDPCTGCCRRVACPSTSYRLRSRCNAVVSYVQRCEMVPVTTYRRSCCYEPVVSQPCCPDPCATPGITEAPGAGGIAPIIDENPNVAPRIDEEGATLPEQNLPITGGSGKPLRGSPEPPVAAPQPALRLDRFTNAEGPRLQGRVVSSDRATPRANTKLIFVNAQKQDQRQAALADQSGQFNVTLPEGDWLIYMADGSGKAVYHSRIQMQPQSSRVVTVVSRR